MWIEKQGYKRCERDWNPLQKVPALPLWIRPVDKKGDYKAGGIVRSPKPWQFVYIINRLMMLIL